MRLALGCYLWEMGQTIVSGATLIVVEKWPLTLQFDMATHTCNMVGKSN